MSSPFSRSLRALDADPSRTWWTTVVAAALIVGWGAWFLFARVPLYETSTSARIEATSAAYPVQARLAGRAIRVSMGLGTRVKEGDVLVEIEADAERLVLQEARARRDALAPEIAAVRDEIAAEERALDDERRAAVIARDEQRAVLQEADVARALAEDDARRFAQLRAKGVIPEADESRARAEAARRRATAEAAAAALARVEHDERTRESDRLVRIQRLRGTRTRLEGEAATAAATIKRLEYEIERRTFRAPVDGRIAEAAELRVGGVVDEGDRLAAIVPDGPLRVVAQFTAAAAIGRVREGQPGRVRLPGFPWTEYGSLHASVSRVANEIRDGLVRVELAVDRMPSALPLSHALPGNVEVEVERVRPFSLVFRTLGGWLTRPAVAAPAPSAGT
jgi:membrane fusion protein (multidrug efflux system)